MKITRQKFMNIANVLAELSTRRMHPRATCAINYNNEHMKQELMAIGKAQEALKPFEAERIQAIKDCAIDGNGIKTWKNTANGMEFKIPLDKKELFNEKAKDIDARAKETMDADELFMAEEIEHKFWAIPFNEFCMVPQSEPNLISADELNVLSCIMKDLPDENKNLV